MRPRIAFVTSHPIQYQVPVFRCLTENRQVDLTVMFAQIPDQQQQGSGFGVEFEWDIPLLEGYRFEILENKSANPDVTRFSGCDTPAVRQVLKNGQFDAVVVNGWVVKTCLQTLWACLRLGIPCIVRGEANDLRPRAKWKRWLQARLVHRYAACLYIGQASREFYLNRGVPEDRLFAAPYCVENIRFAQALDHSKLDAIQRFGLSADLPTFLFSGKLEPKKRPQDLIRASGIALQNGARFQILIVGDGPLRSECEQLAEDARAAVIFAGFLNQSEIPLAYRASDCLVLPSDHGETWGLVVNEAMACELPAITSDQVGCTADLITDSETGFCYPCGDIDRLASVLARSASDRDQLAALGKNAAARIAKYAPAVAASGIEQAVASVAGR